MTDKKKSRYQVTNEDLDFNKDIFSQFSSLKEEIQAGDAQTDNPISAKQISQLAKENQELKKSLNKLTSIMDKLVNKLESGSEED